jgi:hypothetical protein
MMLDETVLAGAADAAIEAGDSNIQFWAANYFSQTTPSYFAL